MLVAEGGGNRRLWGWKMLSPGAQRRALLAVLIERERAIVPEYSGNGVRTYPWGSGEVALPREALYALMVPRGSPARLRRDRGSAAASAASDWRRPPWRPVETPAAPSGPLPRA